MKLNKSKCQILHLRWGYLYVLEFVLLYIQIMYVIHTYTYIICMCYTYKFGNEKLVSNPGEKVLEVWVDGRLNTSQHCA